MKQQQPLRAIIPLAAAFAAVATAAQAPPARAEPSAAPSPPVSAAPEGWTELVDSLRTLPERILAKLPEDQRNDPQVRQEVGRLALEALAASSLDAIASDGDHPAFIPQIGQTLNVGQPNADTIYRSTSITPGGTYRLRGRRGSLPIFNVAQSFPTPNEAGATTGQVRLPAAFNDFNALHVDKSGRFDVILSPERPAGYTGDWWKLDPRAVRLLMRMVSSDWGKEEQPTVSIERLDGPATRPRPPAAELEQRLRRLPGATDFIALLLVRRVESLREQGFVNRLKVMTSMGQVPGQFYYEGAYELADSEALILEAKVPQACRYRSLLLTNELYETTDWINNQSSLNDAQAKPDKDGVLRVVVSAKDPGVPNWLDTAGYPRGIVQGRWTGCSAQPIPTARKVALGEVRAALPPETRTISQQERERVIRERRAAYQQRPLW
ncbi:hypothetical protein LJR225_002293 [Phenylobacterium sp. LjRoot225]|uniref:hypothetical protein n=1 Tax=Phenylobacterium sp. LjRoot225 TaxID=3342285 RepID=UPI003ECE1B12